MTEKGEPEILSRRKFSILGLATLGLASAVLMVSGAETEARVRPLVLPTGVTATPETTRNGVWRGVKRARNEGRRGVKRAWNGVKRARNGAKGGAGPGR